MSAFPKVELFVKSMTVTVGIADLYCDIQISGISTLLVIFVGYEAISIAFFPQPVIKVMIMIERREFLIILFIYCSFDLIWNDCT
jgi:hypothetical protein